MRSILFATVSLALISCHSEPRHEVKHALQGAWFAEDGTIFHFRKDGSFHGIDFRKEEIWGNWVVLSSSRIGFQSLLHTTYYNPQYAEVAPGDSNAMDYISSNSTNFIHAVRMEPSKADARIQEVIAPHLHHPVTGVVNHEKGPAPE